MKREIEALVVAKGFYNSREDVPKKLLFAFIELGEAADAWKKGLSEEIIAEELVDVIFYVLDASRLACPSVNMDEMLRKKHWQEKLRGPINTSSDILSNRQVGELDKSVEKDHSRNPTRSSPAGGHNTSSRHQRQTRRIPMAPQERSILPKNQSLQQKTTATCR